MLQFKVEKPNLNDAIGLFNKKWKDGLRYLQENGLIDNNPNAFAQFLKTNKDALDFEQLGECLSDQSQVETLRAYVKLMQLEGLGYTQALRKIMTEFKFPGEAQKIDRVMQAFGDGYYAANVDHPFNDSFEFKSGDAVYTFGFSCVMLNTDSHNPSIKKKITLEEFIRNNRGINEGANFSEQFLTSVYKDITRSEIKLKNDGIQAASLTDFDLWAKGQGDYHVGYLARYYLGMKPKAQTPVDDAKVQEKAFKAQEDYSKWASGKGGYRFGYLTQYYLKGQKPTSQPPAPQLDNKTSVNTNSKVSPN